MPDDLSHYFGRPTGVGLWLAFLALKCSRSVLQKRLTNLKVALFGEAKLPGCMNWSERVAFSLH